ncbi:MAG: glycyl-radical enzyme activating protein [candidate division KSB1 bacterium]|nr:glycyl-radical enzyme activating protein [candidate division KSB1 bacterium]
MNLRIQEIKSDPLSLTGVVFNIQRFSIHDGPGIRTTIFLKGCPLRCFWCHNPEGIHPHPEIQFFPERCIGCGQCFTVCSQGAHELREGRHIFHRQRCTGCGSCVETCYARALELTGKRMTVRQVVEEVLRDRPFYETSGGGVTLSGGEPVWQRDFARAILECCQAEGLHTAIETVAYCSWPDLDALLPVTDLILMDLKHLNPDKHRLVTGGSNKRILANARRLAQTDKPLIFRIPVVPSVNDTPEEIGAMVTFIRSLADLRAKNSHNIRLELLPFHRLAGDKYRSLGLEYRAGQLEPPSKEKMEELTELARTLL